MKLLFLLLPVCALGFSVGDRQLQTKHGEISDEAKAELQKAWGMDPEVRRARLERIAKKAAQRHNGTSADSPKTEIPHVKLQKPFKNAPVDIFELNSQLGIDKYLFEGDIHLTEEQLDEVERQMDGNGRSKRQAKKFANKWTDNTVYFFFDENFTDERKRFVRAAHQYIQSHTTINFVEDRNATNRIRVNNGQGCHSSVGMIGGQQSISLGNGCSAVGIAAHEFIHALGFLHTQSRSDRNTYVTVNYTNIEPGEASNYELMDANSNYLYTPYEYGSVMHYRADSLAKTPDTVVMTPKDMKYLYTMGNRQISFYDIQMINRHYDANCPAQNAPQCQNGGYPNPRDCSKCNCPAGFAGDLCNQRPSGCGEILAATSRWQNVSIEIGEDGDSARFEYTTCTHWITAPQGKKIRVKITEMEGSQCQYGCPFNGIEIKKEENIQKRNPLFCCEEFRNQVFSSSQNPTPIISFNRYKISRFTIAYRFMNGPQTQSTTTPATTTRSSPCVDQFVNGGCTDFIADGGTCAELGSETAREYCAKTCGYC